MADTTILTGVKNALGITGDFTDNAISAWIDVVVNYMQNAGVSDAVISASVGVVARGVSDLWDNDGGNVKFSPAFQMMVSQLALKSSSFVANNGGGA